MGEPAVTMILSLLSEKWIIQVSDRRLTQPNGRVVDDQSNKALFWCADHVIAYTGLSRIGTAPSIDWLSAQIAKANGYEMALDGAAVAASNALARMGLRSSTKRVGFIIAGYATVGGNGPVRPLLTVLTNFIRSDGTFAANADSSFSIRHQLCTEGDLLFFPSGPLPAAYEVALRRAVTRAMRHATSPFPIGRLFVHAVDRLAQRSPVIGRNIMCAILPRPRIPRSDRLSVTSGMIPLLDDLRQWDAEYFRTPPDWDSTPHFIYRAYSAAPVPFFGPAVVCGDTQIKGIAFREGAQ